MPENFSKNSVRMLDAPRDARDTPSSASDQRHQESDPRRRLREPAVNALPTPRAYDRKCLVAFILGTPQPIPGLHAIRGTDSVNDSSQAGNIDVEVFGISHQGRVRKNNEDNFTVCNLADGASSSNSTLHSFTLGERGILLLVADGMGGELAGEVASQLCVTTVPNRLFSNLKTMKKIHPPAGVLLLREAIEYANGVIHQKALSSNDFRGMGTTATACVCWDGRLFIGQVGDSRTYLIRDQKLTQLTRDQTFLNYLMDMGAELPEGDELEKRKSILTQAVGTSASIEVQVTYADLRRGDSILICSDGLHNMVGDHEILEILSGPETLNSKGEQLIELANEHGGKDNITAILSRFTGPALRAPNPDDQVELKKFSEEDFPTE